jgi:hypothetical protein
MSAKARFLKKLQEQHPRSVAFDTKAEADIATFRQRISQLQESMETWLNGTEIRTEATTTSLIEFLIAQDAQRTPPGRRMRTGQDGRWVRKTRTFQDETITSGRCEQDAAVNG